MFKLAKYYVLANIYKRAKFSVLSVLTSLAAMMVLTFVFSDLLAMSEGSMKIVLVVVKWILLLGLLGFALLHMLKIASKVSFSFGEKNTVEVVIDEKKERVMEKTKLRNRSEIIMDKYRKAG